MAEGSSPLKLGHGSSKKRKLDIKLEHCIICQRNTNETVLLFTENSQCRFFDAVKQRKDDIFWKFINTYGTVEDFFKLSIELVYHKSCYKSYTSDHNIGIYTKRPKEISKQVDTSVVFTRSQSTPVDWNACIFCSHKSFKQDRRLLKIRSAERIERIRKVATSYSDPNLLIKINDESFSFKAQYHNQCMTKYLLREQTTGSEERCNDDLIFSAAFKCLISHISDDLLINKKAFFLNSLLDKFYTFLPDNIDRNVSTRKLQRWLENHFGSSVVIQTQQGQGKSNIIMSSSITLSDAMKAVTNLKAELKWTDIHNVTNDRPRQTDDQLIHTVVGMIRNDISKVLLSSDHYPSSTDASLVNANDIMPSRLVTLLYWLIDDKAFASCSNLDELQSDNSRRCLSLAECIVALNRRLFTPFTLGLGIQLHHEFGSKRLIEILSAHGFCVSYTELRRYLTSAANHEMENLVDDRYIPGGITPIPQGGHFIQEGSDNIDLNTETIDGKNTFHSMARAVFQTQAVGENFSDVRIKRGSDRSLSVDETTSLTDVIPFAKPKVRPEPCRRQDAFKKLMEISTLDDKGSFQDMIWVFLRLLLRDVVELPLKSEDQSSDQIIPFWTGFNYKVSVKQIEKSVVSYPPIIDAKPTDFSTVYTVMKKCLDMTNEAGQSIAVQTFDQQLYALAQQVKWSKPDIFDHHILRLGGFHSLSCFISTIGKLWADGGLRDLLVDSGVYAGNTAEHMLNGKEFNRAVRGLTLVYEALQILYVSAFLHWLRSFDHFDNIPLTFCESLDEFHSSFSSNGEPNHLLLQGLNDMFESDIQPLVDRFREWGYESSPTFRYWEMFLTAVQILLSNVRAERDGDWSAHLMTSCRMLPYFFITNKNNYSRWMPVYILDMLEIPNEVQSAFNSGEFSVRQTSGSFKGIWSDMGTEKTVIKDSKGSGGIVGITSQKSALVRWSLTRHFLAAFSCVMRGRAGLSTSTDSSHEETKPTALKRDEDQVLAIVNHVNQTMTDPFDVESHPECLINISTGMHASKEVQESLLSAVSEGKAMCKKFVEKALTIGNSDSFNSPIQRSKLKTFDHMNAKTPLKCKSGEVVTGYINPEILFRRALVLANSRDDVTLESILSRPVGPIPVSLFHEDGTMRKTSKSDLVKQFEKEVSSVVNLPSFDPAMTTYIRDGMALVQCMDPKKNKTFGDLGKAFCNNLLPCFKVAHTVVDVFDRYNGSNSIKAGERDRRSKSFASAKVYQVIEGRLVPDWKKFLALSENKQSMISFLGEFMATLFENEPFLVSGHQYFMAGSFENPEIVRQFSEGVVGDCPELFSTQEEADTRMILHAFHADKAFKEKGQKGRIIIKSADTDVVVLCVHYYKQLTSTQEFWVHLGNVGSFKDSRRFLPIHELSSSLSDITCGILPAVHALTGCDTTSSLFGVGKTSVYKVIKEASVEFEGLTELGGSDDELAISNGTKFVARLYDAKKKFAFCHSNINKLRVKIATSKDAGLVKLPPSEAALKQHILRASFQTKIWLSATLAKPPLPSPLDYGWHRSHDSLCPVFFEGNMSAEFLQDLVCTCKGKTQCKKSYVCFDQSLPCTDLCGCQGADTCRNAFTFALPEENADNSVNGQEPEPCNFPCLWQQVGNFTSYQAGIIAGAIVPSYPAESDDVFTASFSEENPSEISFIENRLTFVCHEITDQFIIIRTLVDQEYYYFCAQTIKVSDDPLQFEWILNGSEYGTDSDKCTRCRDPDTVFFFRDESAQAIPAATPYLPFTCTTPAECTECESCDLCTEAEKMTLEDGCNTPNGPTSPPPVNSPNCKKARGK